MLVNPRHAKCGSCNYEFQSSEKDKINGRLPCPLCDNNSYWNETKEENYIPVLRVLEGARKGVKS